jgi:nickel superoxide dismutase
MKTLLLGLAAPALALAAASTPSSAPAPAPAAAPVHCQVPCGIYGDLLRIDLLKEDAATIEKGMGQLQAFQAEESPNLNQVVRWTTTKDDHAQKIQDQVMDYWLAQRVKFPKDDAGRAKYLEQLERLHQVTVHAMKCKQTTDTAHVAALRTSLMAFAESYFSAEDLKHVKDHHGDDHR